MENLYPQIGLQTVFFNYADCVRNYADCFHNVLKKNSERITFLF